MKAKRRIHKFNFDQEKMISGALTHVALVDQAANLTEALVMKAHAVTTRSESLEEYDDNGNYILSNDTVRIYDDGSGEVRVVENSNKESAYYVRIR